MGYKSDQTRQNICRAATELFAREGFQRVTMQSICQAAGLSRGGLYRYYDNTAAVFEDIASGFAKHLEEQFEKSLHAGASANEMLDSISRQIETEMTDPESSLTAAIYEYCHCTGSDYLESIYKNLREIWKRFIEYGISTGEFNNVDAEAGADLIIFTYEGVRMGSHVVQISSVTAKNVTVMIRKLLVRAE